jgi:uncharacterized protein YdeI (YjbR/CyaY-like superfamily)
MQTKSGHPIPSELVERLRADENLKAQWDLLKPDAQLRHSLRIDTLPKDELRQERTEDVARMTRTYAQRIDGAFVPGVDMTTGVQG